MRCRCRCVVWATVLAIVGGACLAAPEVAPEVRRSIADRTVAVETSLATGGKATGFIWRRSGTVSQIVTMLAPGRRFEQFPKATVIHRPGTRESKRHAAQILAYDHASGMAVMAVDSAELPEPLTASPVELKAGMDLVLGMCPRGLTTNQRQESPVMVTGASVGAIRESRVGPILQLDADIPPGGEGGPVLLPNGQVAGIAVFEHGDTLISFAFPLTRLGIFSSGRPSTPSVFLAQGKEREVQVGVPLLDLTNKVRGCSLHFLAKSDMARPQLPKGNDWELLSADMTEVKVPVTPPLCTWRRTVRAGGLLPGHYWVQARTELADGTRHVSPPELLYLPPPAVPPAAAGGVPKECDIQEVRFEVDPKEPPLQLLCKPLRRAGPFQITEVVARGQALEELQSGAVPKLSEDQRDVPLDGVEWALDGNALYVLSGARSRYSRGRAQPFGVEISRLPFDSDEAAAHLRLNDSVCELHPTNWGLVAVVPRRGLLFLDSETLAVRGRLGVPRIASLLVASQSPYAVAVVGARGRGDATGYGRHLHEGAVTSLQTVNLAACQLGETYGGPGAGPDVPADHRFAAELVHPLALSDSGGHLLVSGRADRRAATWVCPLRAGVPDVSACVRLDWRAERFYPEPGSDLVLGFVSPTECRRLRLPSQPPDQASWGVRFIDPTAPGDDAPCHWGCRIAISASRLFLYTSDQRLRMVDRRGGGEVVLPLSGGPRGVESILPAPDAGRFLMVAGKKLLLFEHGQAEAPEEVAATEANSPLEVHADASRNLERQRIVTHPEQGTLPPSVQLDAATNTAYALGSKGLLVRADLASLTQTHRVDEQATCTGLALCKGGVLVAVSDAGVLELRLHDAGDLRLLRRVPLPVPMTAFSSRPTADAVFMRGGNKLWLFDSVNASLAALPETGGTASSGLPVISGDGERFYVVERNEIRCLTLADGKLAPSKTPSSAVRVAGIVCADDTGRYLGVRPVARVVLDGATAWSPPPVVSPGAPGTRESLFAVLDARTLLPLHQVSVPSASSFAFDAGQSQLVTSGLTLCFPDGRVVVPSLPPQWAQELRKAEGIWACGGWFVQPSAGGICRYRFRTTTMPTEDWLR